MEKTKNVSKNGVLKSALKISGSVLLYLIIAVALFVLVVSVSAKKDVDGTATVFGKQLRFVQSDSMESCEQTDVSGYKIKSIPVKSCVFIEVVPEEEEKQAEWYKNLSVGDVLTFKYVYTRQETITHRIVDIKEKESGGYLITLMGENADSNLLSQTIDTSLIDSPNYIIGKVTGQSYLLGLAVYALNTPVGLICFIIIPCLIIIAFEVMRLIKVFGKDKKEKIKAERQKQADEIEELKRQLAALQLATTQNGANQSAANQNGEAQFPDKNGFVAEEQKTEESTDTEMQEERDKQEK